MKTHDPLRGSTKKPKRIIDKPRHIRVHVTNILIIGNARDESMSKWTHLIETSDVIIACDGAMRNCIEQHVAVDYLIGDMDSISQEILDQSISSNVEVIENNNQENNDLTKAILFAHELDAKTIDIIGVDGGDSDHQFCNYMSLVECQTNATIHLDDCTVSAITIRSSKHHSVEIGALFSVFAIGTCLGVNLTGAKWELKDSRLTSSSNGLHNIATSEKLAINCESGNLLLFINR
jgi:thiamine pyrophosphokinase